MKKLLLGLLLSFGGLAPAFAQQTVVGAQNAICDPFNAANCMHAATLARVQSAATTNATSVKTAPALLQTCSVGNNGAAAAYLKIYNKASAPTVGTDTPVFTLFLPIGNANDFWPGNIGIPLSVGFAYAITAGAADTDTAAVAANQVVGFCAYN